MSSPHKKNTTGEGGDSQIHAGRDANQAGRDINQAGRDINNNYFYPPSHPLVCPLPPKDSSLYYNLDRKEQVDILKENIKNHDWQRPFLCILHGNQYQASSRFLEIIQEENKLSNTLGLSRDVNIQDLPVLLPGNPSNFQDWFLRRLRESIMTYYASLDEDASLEEINDYLSKWRVPVLIHANLSISHSQPYKKEMVHHYLNFWSNWTNPGNNQKLLVFLCVQYVIQDEGKRDERTNLVWNKLLRQVFLFWRKQRSLKDEMIAFLEEIEHYCVLLPELGNIRRDDVHYWAQQVKDQYEQALVLCPDALTNAICGEYDDIPMLDAAERLYEYLKKSMDERRLT